MNSRNVKSMNPVTGCAPRAQRMRKTVSRSNRMNYALDATASLAAPVTWNPVVTNQASASGALTFTITPSQGMSFFRTRFVP